MKNYKLAVVGATGVVGRTALKVLEEKNLPISEYAFFASKRSCGQKVSFLGKDYTIQELNENSFDEHFDFAIFSAGSSTSEKYAPIAASKGCIVVDNSSCFRMDKDVPLVVPEVNPEDIKKNKGIIANPNCSTIQAVVALKPLDDNFKIKRIVYSTYQAVSGAGRDGIYDLENGIEHFQKGDNYINNTKSTPYELKKFPYPIFNNCLPHIDNFLDNGYTKEEMKMINETKKILHNDSLAITATTVRVPVINSHSESINVEFEKEYNLDDVKKILSEFPGITVIDDISNLKYPIATDCTGKNEVFVGRIRRDYSLNSGINLWVVADNIRKGAATNAIQIVEKLIEFDK